MKKFLLSAIVMISCIAHNVLADQSKEAGNGEENKDEKAAVIVCATHFLKKDWNSKAIQIYNELNVASTDKINEVSFAEWIINPESEMKTDSVFVTKQLSDGSFDNLEQLYKAFDRNLLRQWSNDVSSLTQRDCGDGEVPEYMDKMVLKGDRWYLRNGRCPEYGRVTFKTSELSDPKHSSFVASLATEGCVLCSDGDKQVIIDNSVLNKQRKDKNPQEACENYKKFFSPEMVEQRMQRKYESRKQEMQKKFRGLEKAFKNFNISSY